MAISVVAIASTEKETSTEPECRSQGWEAILKKVQHKLYNDPGWQSVYDDGWDFQYGFPTNAPSGNAFARGGTDAANASAATAHAITNDWPASRPLMPHAGHEVGHDVDTSRAIPTSPLLRHVAVHGLCCVIIDPRSRPRAG